MRFEKKFRIPLSELPLIKCFFSSINFYEHYKSRYISSIYYDTVDFNLYKDSVNGIANRRKLRARFYDDNYKDIKLEEKIKISEMGYKITHDIRENKNIILIDLITNKNFKKKIISIPSMIFKSFLPVSYINYSRRYFISNDGKTRITLDEDITYSKVNSNTKNLYVNSEIPDQVCVVEVKFDEENQLANKSITKISSYINSPLTRNSKYCNSIECLF